VLPEQPKKIWIEVVTIWFLALAIIAVFKIFSFIPFIRENLWGIAGIAFLLIPLEWLHRKKVDPATFGISWQNLKKGLLWALLLVGLTFPLYIPAYIWWFGHQSFHFSLLWESLPGDFWQEVLGFFLLVAIPEEVFYRGYMQTRLDAVFKRRVTILGAKVGWSLVVTSAFFAVGHLVEPRLDKLGTFFPGLVFGWLRARTGSVGGAVIFHALCNIWARMLFYGFSGV
jgi:membrane protease YdiL (CAAX protease family)